MRRTSNVFARRGLGLVRIKAPVRIGNLYQWCVDIGDTYYDYWLNDEGWLSTTSLNAAFRRTQAW